MRLIKNNINPKDCGIIAAFNASSWCDINKSYKEVEKMARSCGYNPLKGIYYFQFSALMKKLNIPIKKVKPKSAEELEKSLYAGSLLTIFYIPTGQHNGHVVTVFLDHKGNIRIINPESDRVTWNDLMRDIHSNGMKEFYVFKISNKRKTTGISARYDDARTG